MQKFFNLKHNCVHNYGDMACCHIPVYFANNCISELFFLYLRLLEMSLLKLFLNVIRVYRKFLHGHGGHLKHGIHHYCLHNRPQSACPEPLYSMAFDTIRSRAFFRKLKFDTIEQEHLLVLTHDGILRLGEDAAQCLLVERFKARQHLSRRPMISGMRPNDFRSCGIT